MEKPEQDLGKTVSSSDESDGSTNAGGPLQPVRQISAEEALAVIEAQKQKRVADCSAELQRVLQTHGCRLEARVVIRGSEVSSCVVVSVG